MIVPLSEKSFNLLYEVYGLPLPTTTQIVVGGSLYYEGSVSRLNVNALSKSLSNAIDLINTNQSVVDRVTEILDEFEGFAIDPSNIDKDGYSFRASQSKKAILEALKPYTGITLSGFGHRSGGRIPLS